MAACEALTVVWCGVTFSGAIVKRTLTSGCTKIAKSSTVYHDLVYIASSFRSDHYGH
jgi:hypothetical protein